MLKFLFGREKQEAWELYEEYLDLAQRDPQNAALQLKMAEIYRRKGEEEKAVAKFLQAAEIFTRDDFFPQALAVYDKVLSISPHLVHANQKKAQIYSKMGMFAEAIAQYKAVAKHYEQWGRREKVPRIANLIRDLERQKEEREKEKKSAAPAEAAKAPGAGPVAGPLAAGRSLSPPRKRRPSAPRGEKAGLFYDLEAELAGGDPAGLGEIKEISMDKTFGFEEIFKELQETVIPAEVYPNFNYQMGLACREMGFTEAAIEQLQMAAENGQNRTDALKMLSRCFRDKGWFHEAQKNFEKALLREGSRGEKTSSFKSEGVLIQG